MGALGADGTALGALRVIVGAIILALLDLKSHAAGVASMPADFATSEAPRLSNSKSARTPTAWARRTP